MRAHTGRLSSRIEINSSVKHLNTVAEQRNVFWEHKEEIVAVVACCSCEVFLPFGTLVVSHITSGVRA